MKKIIKKLSGLVLILAIITVWAIQSSSDFNRQSSEGEGLLTTADTLSNTKICWGVKRAESHQQPDLGETNVKLMEEYNGIYMGNSEKKYVYLTFDSGYEAGYTEQILDVLKENEVTAVFFITAHYSNTASELVQRMIDEGHIIRKSYS